MPNERPGKKSAKKSVKKSVKKPAKKPAKKPVEKPVTKREKPAIDRAEEIARVRAVVKRHLPKGYTEAVRGHMVVWEVPLSVYPDTYNGHALWYAALAEQKNYLALHLMVVYGSAVLAKRLADGFKAAGKTLDMGKACIRFKKADDLALDAIGAVVSAVPMDAYVAMAKAARRR